MKFRYASFDQIKSIIDSGDYALRRIPKFKKIIVEKRHFDQYPDGKIVYLEDYKREMCVCQRKLKYGGKWFIVSETGSGRSINPFSISYLIKDIQTVFDYIKRTEK